MSRTSTLFSQLKRKDDLGKRLAAFARIKEHAPAGEAQDAADNWDDLYLACEREGWI